MELYRIRSINALLDQFNELEKQEIYFAPTNDLNDPMEDYKEFIWNGDKIIWRNFLKHYLLNLDRAMALAVLSDDVQYFDLPRTDPFISHDALPTPMYKKKMNRIYDKFFSLDIVVTMLDYLTEPERDISSNELSIHLFMVHLKAIDIMFREYKIFRDTAYQEIADGIDFSSIFQAYRKLHTEEGDVFEIFVAVVAQTISNIKLSLAIKSYNEKNKRIQYLLVDFVEDYLESLKVLVYPEWYVACFMTNISNPIVWGHYASGHNGACLIFDTDIERTERMYLGLDIPEHKNDGSFTSRRIRLDFSEVTYQNELPKLSFFDNLGSASGALLKTQWYYDENGNQSKCADEIFNDINEWRKKHWHKFNKIQNTKTVHWKYENEHRLVFNSLFYSMKEVKDRKFKYDFKSLKGIVFGLKMKTDDKIKVINIIRDKCTKYGREEFEFYQAVYDQKEDIIKPVKLSFIGG